MLKVEGMPPAIERNPRQGPERDGYLLTESLESSGGRGPVIPSKVGEADTLHGKRGGTVSPL
jgi:hypothetical protein